MEKRYLKFYLITNRKGKGGAQVYFEELLNCLGTEDAIVFDLKQDGLFNLIKRLYTLQSHILIYRIMLHYLRKFLNSSPFMF